MSFTKSIVLYAMVAQGIINHKKWNKHLQEQKQKGDVQTGLHGEHRHHGTQLAVGDGRRGGGDGGGGAGAGRGRFVGGSGGDASVLQFPLERETRLLLVPAKSVGRDLVRDRIVTSIIVLIMNMNERTFSIIPDSKTPFV